jgi:hypothetical protein
LRDRLAGPAGELLAHWLDHFPLAGNELQRFRRAATAWADRGQRIDDTLARRMLGQRTMDVTNLHGLTMAAAVDVGDWVARRDVFVQTSRAERPCMPLAETGKATGRDRSRRSTYADGKAAVSR